MTGLRGAACSVADLTSLGEINDRAVRNANVMYEVGLAHAVRQPEEVLLFRSDDRDLLFDITNVRVHRYDPDGSPEIARTFVTDTIVSSLQEVDLKKNLAVRRVAESLDYHSWMTLLAAHREPFQHPVTRTMGQALGAVARARAIGRLLEVGALRAEFIRVTAELLKDNEGPAERLVTYTMTPFGSAVAAYGINELGLFSSGIRELLEAAFGDAAGNLDSQPNTRLGGRAAGAEPSAGPT